VKNFLALPLCLGICLTFWAATGGAQQKQPDQPTAPPPPNPLDIKLQAPPTLPPKAPDVRQPGETGWWISLDSFFPSQQPVFNKGRGATFTTASETSLPGAPKMAAGAEIGIAIGLHNTLRFSYFSSSAAGDFTNTNPIQIWNQTYPSGTLVSSNNRLQNGKISFDFLTWPYPVESRRFRLKTLWQVQYTSMQTNFDAPNLPLYNSDGSPIVDSTGNPISYAGNGSHWFVSPEIGLGVSYFSGRHLRFEANASGFTIPHHNTIWDMDATANIHFSHMELRLGGKAFHFKTSTNAEFYERGTYFGPFVGIRWDSN
jgi:hypothetical protein